MDKGPTIKTLVLVAAVILATMAGCSKERVYEGIYEGVRMQDQAKQQADDPDKMPTYDEYSKERQEVIQEQQEK